MRRLSRADSSSLFNEADDATSHRTSFPDEGPRSRTTSNLSSNSHRPIRPPKSHVLIKTSFSKGEPNEPDKINVSNPLSPLSLADQESWSSVSGLRFAQPRGLRPSRTQSMRSPRTIIYVRGFSETALLKRRQRISFGDA